MIKLISGATRIGKHVYTPADGYFEASPEVETRLVALRVAVFASNGGTEAVATTPEGLESVKAGDNMSGSENGAESVESAHLDSEQFKALTNAKLTELAKDMGIDTAKLKTKAQLIAAITDVPLEDAISEDDGNAIPALEPEAPVV